MFPFEHPIVMLTSELYHDIMTKNKEETQPMYHIYQAFRKRNYEKVEMYLKNCTNVDEHIYGKPLLFHALRENDSKMVDLLLKNGADAHKTNFTGDTYLAYATMHNNPKIVHMLLQHGVNMNQQGTLDFTPLDIAINIKSKELATTYIRSGCQLNFTNYHGKTPLMQCIITNQTEIALELIRNGAALTPSALMYLQLMPENPINPFFQSLLNRRTTVHAIRNRLFEQLQAFINAKLPKYNNMVQRVELVDAVIELKQKLFTQPLNFNTFKVIRRLNHILNHPINQIPRDHTFKSVFYKQQGEQSLPRSQYHFPDMVMERILNFSNTLSKSSINVDDPLLQQCEKINHLFCALKNTRVVPYDYTKMTHTMHASIKRKMIERKQYHTRSSKRKLELP